MVTYIPELGISIMEALWQFLMCMLVDLIFVLNQDSLMCLFPVLLTGLKLLSPTSFPSGILCLVLDGILIFGGMGKKLTGRKFSFLSYLSLVL